MKMTIIDQINKFLINLFDFEFDLKNSGRTKTKTAIKKIAGIISSNPTYQPFQKPLAFWKNFLILGFDFSFSIFLKRSNKSFCSLFKNTGTSVLT